MSEKQEKKINTIYAFVSEQDGDGIVGMRMGSMIMPLVCLEERNLVRMSKCAQELADESGKVIKLLRFTQAEEVQAFRKVGKKTEAKETWDI